MPPIGPDKWGVYGWKFIHHIALGYPKIPTTNDKNTKLTNADINKIKKEIVELKSIINSFRSSIIEIDKKVKRRNSIVTESAKPTNKKDEIKFLMSEIADIKLSIKNIERKLKMD